MHGSRATRTTGAADGRAGLVLVTGGGGFIGSHLVERLVQEGIPVRVLEKPGASTAHLDPLGVEVVAADIRDADAVLRAARGCDVILHLAANPNLWARDPAEFEAVNHQGTRHVLAAARACGASRTVYVSTESILASAHGADAITEATRTALGQMIGPYCRSKWLAEEAARHAASHGDPIIIVRPSIPIGPGDLRLGPPSRMICDFCNGRVKGYLEGTINLIDVRDVADGIWAAAKRGRVGAHYLLANEEWRIIELLRFLAEITGRRAPRWRVPYFGALAFAHVEELVCRHVTKGNPMATVTGVRLTRRSFRFDGRDSVKELGLSAYRSCRDAVAEAVEWFARAGLIPAPRVLQ